MRKLISEIAHVPGICRPPTKRVDCGSILLEIELLLIPARHVQSTPNNAACTVASTHQALPFLFILFLTTSLISCRKFGSPYLGVRLQQRQEQCYTHSCHCVQYFCVSCMCPNTGTWLPVFGIFFFFFYVRADVDACDCTWPGAVRTR